MFSVQSQAGDAGFSILFLTMISFFFELKEAVEEVKLAKQGKIKLQSAKDFLNEL
ncbi:MAG: hypothetical protein Q7W54_12300 [Bacteroidota bacterium]|nr:hypothetical protein [Bacteroidota bacterium]